MNLEKCNDKELKFGKFKGSHLDFWGKEKNELSSYVYSAKCKLYNESWVGGGMSYAIINYWIWESNVVELQAANVALL